MTSLSLFYFVNSFIASVVVAFFPLLFQSKGMDPAKIGILLAVGPFVSVIAQPLWGYVADKKQTIKKIVLLLLFMTLVLSSSILIFDNFFALFVSLIFLNFFMSPIGPLMDSLSTVFTIENNKNYGAIRMWGSIGFAVASTAIGAIIGFIGMGKVGFLLAGFIIVTIIVATTLKDRSAKVEPISFAAISNTFKNKDFIVFLVIVFLIGLPHRMNDSIMGLYLSELGANEATVGSAWSIAAISEVPLMLITPFLLRKYKHLALMGFAGVLYTIRWFLYGQVDSATAILILQAMQGLTFSLFLVTCLQYVSVLVPKGMLATGQTIYFAVQTGLGGIFGSIIGGFLMDTAGAEFVYMFGALVSLLGTILCITIHFAKKRSKSENLIEAEL